MKRREFLRTLSYTALWLGLPQSVLAKERSKVKIDRIDLFPLRYPMTGYFKFFTGPHGSAGRAAVIVKITADSGTIGWGQTLPIAKWSYETLETAFIVLRDYYAPVLIGRDPTDIVGAHLEMSKAVAPGFTTGMPISRAGIDLALHDLCGKLQGKSLSQMWGKPAGGPLTLSWTVNVTKIEGAKPIMDEGKKRGYKHFNIKVAPDPDFDIALAQEVRRLAPETFLWADANGGYDPDTALQAAPKLADVGVDVLEAPLRPNRISGYQALKKQAALPIIMDEGVVSPTDLEEFIKLGMLDGVAMKPARCGGLLSNKRQIELCQKHNLIWLGSGLTDPDISLAATLGLYGAFGLKKPAALNGPQFLTADVLKKPLCIENGIAYVPEGPGLGIDVDENKVIELMRQSGYDRQIFTTASPQMKFLEDSDKGMLTIIDGQTEILTYCYGDQFLEGLDPKHMRSCFIHPLFSLDGQPLTDNFPQDHLHHHGAFWTWPVVKTRGQDTETWHPAIPSLRQHFSRWMKRKVENETATLIVENVWKLDEKEIVAMETVSLKVYAANNTGRAIDLELKIQAIGGPLELHGALEENKGYGGLALRGAPMFKGAMLTTETGLLKEDSVNVPFRWADLSTKKCGVSIFVSPHHPDFPTTWLIRNSYGGILNVSWPGLKTVVLQPEKPVTLSYRLYIHRGDATDGQIHQAYKQYLSTFQQE